MSLQTEIDPSDRTPAMHPDSVLAVLLAAANDEGYPAYLGWSMEVGDGVWGYVLQAGGTRRAVAVIEQTASDGPDSRWLAQTFRVKREEDLPAVFEDVCLEMLAETEDYEVEQEFVVGAIERLYLGYGMELQYPSVILECNNPALAEGLGDYYRPGRASQHPDQKAENSDVGIGDLGDLIAELLENDRDKASADLIIDIARHMSDQAEELEGGHDIHRVYRTRFQNYSWATDTIGPRVNDLVLIKVNDGSVWHVSSVNFDEEITQDNIEQYCEYGNQIITSDVVSVVVGGIMARIVSAQGQPTPDYLMTNLLDKRQTLARDEDMQASLDYDVLDYLAPPLTR